MSMRPASTDGPLSTEPLTKGIDRVVEFLVEKGAKTEVLDE